MTSGDKMSKKKETNKKIKLSDYDQHPLGLENHKPVTRRDFIAQGFIGFSAVTTLPTLTGLGISAALADDCGGGGGGGSKMTPFMAFDMAGGAALPANFLVGKQGGPMDFLASYDKLGWDPKESGALDDQFGLPMSAKYSGLLEGIIENTTPEARANFRMGGFCHNAQDDSQSNPLNSSTLVLNAGCRGMYVTNGLGSMKSNSGGRSRAVLDDSNLKPVFVGSVNDVVGSTSFGGPGFNGAGAGPLKVLAQAAADLRNIQKSAYRDWIGGAELDKLSKCAYEKSLQFVEGVEGLDPRQDAEARAAYGIAQNSPEGDANVVAASIAMNALRGYSGPGVWTLGGCDYHNGTSTTGDAKDKEMGVQIGRAIELAKRLGKPFFFQLFTDGGCDATTGTRKWRGDSGGKCMTVIGYYNPAGAPKMIRQQVGHFTNGQGAERATLIGSSPAKVAYAVFANYLNTMGMLGEFEKYAPGIFTPAELDEVMIFESGRLA